VESAQQVEEILKSRSALGTRMHVVMWAGQVTGSDHGEEGVVLRLCTNFTLVASVIWGSKGWLEQPRGRCGDQVPSFRLNPLAKMGLKIPISWGCD
jgi:hypothetical protein